MLNVFDNNLGDVIGAPILAWSNDGYPISQANDGSCYVDYLDGTSLPVACPAATRPRIVPLPPTLSTNNPFRVSALSSGSLATVNTQIPRQTNYLPILLVGGLLAFLLMKQ